MGAAPRKARKTKLAAGVETKNGPTPGAPKESGGQWKPVFVTAQDICRAAEVGNTNEDIAILAGLSTSTLEARFSAELVRGRSMRRDKIYRLQYELMEKSDKTMLIWLGKNGGNQADKAENEDVTYDLSQLSSAELERFASGTPLKRILGDRASAAA